MKDPNNILNLVVKDEAAQDNFTKLNSLFAGEFTYRSGALAAAVYNLAATNVSWKIFWVRLGDLITLHFGPSYPVTASKAGTGNPALVGILPVNLRPRGDVDFYVEVQNNGTNTQALLAVAQTGVVQWGNIVWVNAAGASLFPTAISYLGN